LFRFLAITTDNLRVLGKKMLLQQKTNLFLLMVAIVVSITAYLLTSKFVGSLLVDISESEKSVVIDNIHKDIAVLDELLLNIEHKWDQELSTSLPSLAQRINNDALFDEVFVNELVDTYKNKQKNPNELQPEQVQKLTNMREYLQQLKQEYQVSDIHLINRELIVFASTFEQEVGLDLSLISDAYTTLLNNLFAKGEFAAHRLSLSDANGKLKKYAYYSVPNSNILVNVDIDVKERLAIEEDNRLGTFIFGKYVSELASKYDVIDDIDLLIISETSQWSLLQEGNDVAPNLARKLYAGEHDAGNTDSSIFIPITLNAYDEIGFKSVLHIAYNNNTSEVLQSRLRYILFGIVLFFVIVLYLVLRFGSGAIFLKRFNSLNQQLKQKSLGDKTEIALSGNDELSMIASEVNKLMQRMEDQIEINKGLHTQSYTDSLTTIANRRYFDEQISIEWRQAKRLKNDFSILMIDIDFFKEYNDRYGHVAGDTSLKKIAQFIDAELTRPRDCVFRYGGEEFMCLLPETDPQGAQLIAQSLNRNIQKLDIEHEGSSIAKSITVSIGCLTVNGNVDLTEDGLMHEVDTLLYLSKTTGKNKVCADYLN
jgi:diguanylate cyclase (GGDEF)-like protein